MLQFFSLISDGLGGMYLNLPLSLVSGTVAWWIGISDLIDEGTFRYQSNGEPIPFPNRSAPWKSTEPNDHRNNEDCAVIMRDGKWNDFSCAYHRNINSICEST